MAGESTCMTKHHTTSPPITVDSCLKKGYYLAFLQEKAIRLSKLFPNINFCCGNYGSLQPKLPIKEPTVC